jgi:hypothetical protein
MGRGHDIFEDLLDVEVNTLVTDRIRVDKMPALPFALLDVLAIYSQALLEVGVDLGESQNSCRLAHHALFLTT